MKPRGGYIDQLELKWSPYDNLIRYFVLKGLDYEKINTVISYIFGLPGIPLFHFDDLQASAGEFKDRVDEWNDIYNKYYHLFFHRDLRDLLIATISAGESPEKISKFIKSKSPNDIPPEDILKIADLFWNLRKVKPLDVAMFLEYLHFMDPKLEKIMRRALAKYDLKTLYLELDILPDEEIDIEAMAKAMLLKSFDEAMKSGRSLDFTRFAEVMVQAAALIQGESDDEEKKDLEEIMAIIGKPGHKKPEVRVMKSLAVDKLGEDEIKELIPEDKENPLESLPPAKDPGTIEISLGNPQDEAERNLEAFFPDIDPWGDE